VPSSSGSVPEGGVVGVAGGDHRTRFGRLLGHEAAHLHLTRWVVRRHGLQVKATAICVNRL
jgi:hypothetical protein